MEHYDSAQLDELLARLATLERKVDGLEGRLSRLSPATDSSLPHASDPYLPDPYAPPPQQQWRATQPAPHSPGVTPPPTGQVPPQREGNVGAYLLSGAAALLVLLAAVSLITLVWEQIPDVWKVIGLALISMAMVSAGTTLAENRPRQQVAAAAITGTGGALGFVTIIGAVLLVGLQTPIAMALMAAWGFVLLLVSWTAGQFFTAVVSALGALVTVGFAWVQAEAYPWRAALIWALVNGYLVALAVVCALLAHYARRMRLAAWLPTTAMVATATALVIGPVGLLSESTPAGIMLLCLPAVILLVQAHHSAHLLCRTAGRYVAAWEWAGVGAALMLAVLHLGLAPAVPSMTRSLIAVVFLVAAALSTAALLPDGDGRRGPRQVADVNLGVMLAVGAAAFAVEPRLLLPAVLALALASLPLAHARQSAPVFVLPLTGLAALAVAAAAQPRMPTVGLSLAAVLVAVCLGVWLEARMAPVPDAPSAGTPPLRAKLLTAASWMIGVDLVVVVPALVERLTPGSTIAPVLAGVSALALSGLGLFTRGCTPLTLVSGTRAGSLEGARGLRTPLVPAVPVISMVGFGLLAVQAAVTLAQADSIARSTAGALRAVPLVVLGLALAVAGARLLLPWLKHSGAALAIVISQSVALWWSAMILTGASPTSMLVTALVLATGTVCIVSGFRLRATAVRHYGLTLVMLVVVKLGVLDLAGGNSITQILALLVAGLACFCLSLVYNRFAHEQARAKTPPVSQPPAAAPERP